MRLNDTLILVTVIYICNFRTELSIARLGFKFEFHDLEASVHHPMDCQVAR